MKHCRFVAFGTLLTGCVAVTTACDSKDSPSRAPSNAGVPASSLNPRGDTAHGNEYPPATGKVDFDAAFEDNKPVPRGLKTGWAPKTIRAQDRRHRKGGATAIMDVSELDHYSAGYWLDSGDGISVRNDYQPGIELRSPVEQATTLYAPTHYAPGGSCIETVTAHWRNVGNDSTYHGHGFWDWCREDPGWGVLLDDNGTRTIEFFDEDWEELYVRDVDGRPSYYTTVFRVAQGSDCWQGKIWNFVNESWDLKFESCGEPKVDQSNQGRGWTIWEVWGRRPCQALPTIGASKIQILYGRDWRLFEPRVQDQLRDDPTGCFGSDGGCSLLPPTGAAAWEVSCKGPDQQPVPVLPVNWRGLWDAFAG